MSETYQGQLLPTGEKHGIGILILENGDRYEGSFVYDEMSGFGKFTWKNSGNVYEGDFVSDTMHGKGKFIWKNGEKYIGDYFEGIVLFCHN